MVSVGCCQLLSVGRNRRNLRCMNVKITSDRIGLCECFRAHLQQHTRDYLLDWWLIAIMSLSSHTVNERHRRTVNIGVDCEIHQQATQVDTTAKPQKYCFPHMTKLKAFCCWNWIHGKHRYCSVVQGNWLRNTKYMHVKTQSCWCWFCYFFQWTKKSCL